MWAVAFTDEAVSLLGALPARAQGIILDGVRIHLAENDPAVETRNKFMLRRASAVADYELRLEEWRVFYRLEDEAGRVSSLVTLLGEKRGNTLRVGGRKITL